MINTRFSLFKAYIAGLRLIFEYISFYAVWYLLAVTVGILVSLCFGVYLHILDLQVLTGGFDWISALLMKWFTDVKLSYDLIPRDVNPYGWLEIFLPEKMLNQALATMSWSEYFHIIILPKIYVIVPMVLIATYAAMSITVGLIKTALSLQSGEQISLRDMYQYSSLVPYYFIVKLVMMVACIIPVALMILSLNVVPLRFLEAVVVGLIFSIYLYQKLRFAKYFVIDQKQTPLQACRSSWNITQGVIFHLLVFSMIALGIMSYHFSGIFLYFFVVLDKQVETNVYRQLRGLE